MDISGGNMGTFSKAEIARELLRCGSADSRAHSWRRAGSGLLRSPKVRAVGLFLHLSVTVSFLFLVFSGAHAPTHYVFGPNDEMEMNPSPQ